MKKLSREDCWVKKYTLTFIVVCLVVYSLQIYYGKSFIYTGKGLDEDGLVQHYNALAYYGEWLRSILKNIFIDHSFSIPEFDLSIGLGADVISTLNYYTIGDPLNLLSVFVPASHTEILYNVLVIVRLYLAGIVFFVYCRYHAYESSRILPGAIIYVFSFYSIVISVLHPNFLNPLIYFPLILLGIDKVLKEKRPLLFIFSCALAAASNFYFFYMMTILMFIYGVIRYIQYHLKEIKFLLLLWEAGRLILYYIIGIMLAAPLFLPSVFAVLGSSRVGGTFNIPKLYEMIYYIKLPIAFMNASADYYSALGYGAVGVLAVGLLFLGTNWKEKAGFKIAFLMGTIFLLIPFFGHMFNGFGYVVNRWVWGYCFAVSLIVVEMFPNILSLPKKAEWIVGGGTVLFAVPTFYFRAGGDKEKIADAAIVLVLFTIFLIVGILACRYLKKATQMTYLLIITANAFLSMFGFYSPVSGNDIERHGDLGMAWQNVMDGPFRVLEGIGKDEFADLRIDTSNLYFTGVRTNSAMLYDVNSVSFYYSGINGNTSDFLHEHWISMPYENRFIDLDARAILSSFMGIKYNIIKSGDESYLPYGYDQIIQEKNGYALYKSESALPMSFVYDRLMSESEYNELSPMQKQQALLQAAIVSENDWEAQKYDMSEIAFDELRFSDSVSDYTIEEVNGIKLLENRIEVEKANGFITLKTESANEVERYFAFENLWYKGKRVSNIVITDGERTRKFEIKSELDGAYANIHNFLCNLGYSENHGASYKIIFSEPGVYTFDSIDIYNQPLGNMKDWIAERQKADVKYSFGEDSISQHVNLDKNGILYVAVPYSSGWKAYVDGKKADVLKINGFGMGVCVGQGEHSVEYEYHTPYMREGVTLMLLGIAASIGLLIYAKKVTHQATIKSERKVW